MEQAKDKLDAVLNDEGLLPPQKELIGKWARHQGSFNTPEVIYKQAYTIRGFGLFIKKPFEEAKIEDLRAYLAFTKGAACSLNVYRQRVNGFYRFIHRHTDKIIENELAHPMPKLVKKPEFSNEQICEMRAKALINTKEAGGLTDANLQALKDFHNYKIASGKVESYMGLLGKLYFIKRLGLFLQGRAFKETTREDIQNFLNEGQESIKRKKKGKTKMNASYKVYLLDFYRFAYGLFGDEVPRKYPDVVSWLYQKRKKSHDEIPKEIIPDAEIKQMINQSTDQRDKALIALMADCSARVGEIANVCIKDLKINEIATEGQYKHLIATVTLRGKTGERTNQLFYSVPYLRLWLFNHPLKDKQDAPLFIANNASKYGQRLSTVGINKMLERAAIRAGIKRHIHAHLFRHTNLTRMARILSESELKIHAGWGSESNMGAVYVHLNEKDVADKLLEKWGIKTKEEVGVQPLMQIQICPNTVCSHQNPAEAKFCLKCGYPLSLKTAVDLKRLKEQEDELQREAMSKGLAGLNLTGVTDIREAIYQIVKKDETLLAKLKEIAEQAQNLAEVEA